jgi:integrase/recombinase XerD
MLDGGADVRHIQALLGHASLATTERYTHVAISKLQQVHARTHPGARGSTLLTPLPPPDEEGA